MINWSFPLRETAGQNFRRVHCLVLPAGRWVLSTSADLNSGTGVFQFVFNFKFSNILKPEICPALLGPFPSHVFKHKQIIYESGKRLPLEHSLQRSLVGIIFFWLFIKALLLSLFKIQGEICAAGPVPRGSDHLTYICSISVAYCTIPLVALWAHTLPAMRRLELTRCLGTRKRENLSNTEETTPARVACEASYYKHKLTKELFTIFHGCSHLPVGHTPSTQGTDSLPYPPCTKSVGIWTLACSIFSCFLPTYSGPYSFTWIWQIHPLLPNVPHLSSVPVLHLRLGLQGTAEHMQPLIKLIDAW